MSKLVIIRGNSGSGKTSLAKTLQARLGPNTMLISHDMIRIQMLNTSGRMGVEKSMPLMSELVKYGRNNSEVTILEGILPSEDYSPLFDAAAEEFGDEIYAFYYDLSFEETLERHRTKPNRNDFTEEDMRRWWLGRDLLPHIREHIFTADISIEAALDRILDDIHKDK